jgi:hypothetical protein
MSHHWPIGLGLNLADPGKDVRSPSQVVKAIEAIEGVDIEAFRTYGRFDAFVFFLPRTKDHGKAGAGEVSRVVRAIEGTDNVRSVEVFVGFPDDAAGRGRWRHEKKG